MSKLLKNWSFLAGSDFITQISGFVVIIRLTRELSPSGFGVFNVVLAFAAIFSIIANGGMSQVIIRYIARVPSKTEEFLRKVFYLRFLWFLLALISLIVYSFFKGDIDLFKLVCIVVLTFSITIWDLIESCSFGKKITNISSSINVVFTVAWLLIVFTLPGVYFTIFNVLVIYCCISLVKSLSFIYFSYRNRIFTNTGHDENGDSKDLKILLKESLPYLWLWSIGIVANQVPIILLDNFGGAEQVGFYSIGAKLVLPLMMVVNTILRALFPFLAEYSTKDPQKFSNLVFTIFSGIIIIGSFLAFFATMLSGTVIPYVFGDKYLPSIESFNYLIWFGVLYSTDLLIGSALSASDKQMVLAKLATVDILIGFPLIYFGCQYGATGLGMGKLIHSILCMSYHWIILSRLTTMKVKLLVIVYIYLFLILSFLISIAGFLDVIAKGGIFIILIGVFYFIRESPLKLIVETAREYLVKYKIVKVQE